MSETRHEHRFNATLIRRKGRCSCGAWATRVGKEWVLVRHAPTMKALETRLRRLQDPNVPYLGEIEVPNVNEDMPEEP